MVKKILVVGSSGFVGSNVCGLLKDKYSIKGVDDLSFGTQKNTFVETVYCNASELTESFLNKFDVLISSFCSNLIYAGEFPNETYKNNLITSINLFSKFKGYIINLSTSSIYGNSEDLPMKETHPERTRNAYDTSKLIMERLLAERGNYTTFRLSNVYGEYQRPESSYSGVVSKFVYSKLKGEKAVVYGNNTRDYTYVGDVVNAVDLAIDNRLNTEVNIGTGVETNTVDLARMVGVDYCISNEVRNIDGINRRFLDTNKAFDLLGWAPLVDLKSGFAKTEEWIKKEYF